MFDKIANEVIKLLRESLTASSGEYDPARVFGYGIVVLGALVFFGLTIYVTIRNGTFDGTSYAVGLGGVASTLISAAGGVWIKRTAEAAEKVTVDVNSTTTTTEVK